MNAIAAVMVPVISCEEDWASHFLEHEISAIYGVTVLGCLLSSLPG